jgi:hypothetical protein
MRSSRRSWSVLILCVVGCSTAGPPPSHTNDGSVDRDAPDVVRDSPQTIDAAIDADMIDAALACKQPNIIHGDGKHNPGMDCMSGCHNHGFSIAGTLYESDGVTPAANATITIVDAANNSQDIVTSTNGNFFSFIPALPPVTVTGSLCPSTQVMVAKPTTGACNSGGCHEPGGVQGTIHL